MSQKLGRARRDVSTPKVGRNANAGLNTGKTNSAAGSDRSGNPPPSGGRRLLQR